MIDFSKAKPFSGAKGDRLYETYFQVTNGLVRFSNGTVCARIPEEKVFGTTLGLSEGHVIYVDVRLWKKANMHKASSIGLDGYVLTAYDKDGNVTSTMMLNATVGETERDFIVEGKNYRFPDVDELFSRLSEPKAGIGITPEVLAAAAHIAGQDGMVAKFDYRSHNTFSLRHEVDEYDVIFIGGAGVDLEHSYVPAAHDVELQPHHLAANRVAEIMGSEYVESMLNELADAL